MEGLYPLRKGLGTTIVAINELPTIPETLWLRLLGKGLTQERAIADLLIMPESDPSALKASFLPGHSDRLLSNQI